MKKVIITIAILVIVAIGAGTYMLKNSVMFDRVNPFLEMDDYYTIVDTEGEHMGEDKIREGQDSYKYEFIGYNVDGEKQPITIQVTKNLKTNAYLKIIAKGKNAKSWEEVQSDEIPSNVLEKLND